MKTSIVSAVMSVCWARPPGTQFGNGMSGEPPRHVFEDRTLRSAVGSKGKREHCPGGVPGLAGCSATRLTAELGSGSL